MIVEILRAIGLVLVVEGLVFALAPGRIEALFDTIRRMPLEARRLVGLTSLVLGVLMITLSRAFT